jgi:hypothetical protein
LFVFFMVVTAQSTANASHVPRFFHHDRRGIIEREACSDAARREPIQALIAPISAQQN